jgi:hypothetical protein
MSPLLVPPLAHAAPTSANAATVVETKLDENMPLHPERTFMKARTV